MEKKERSVNNMKADTTPADILLTKATMKTYLSTIKTNSSGKFPPKVNAIVRELNSIYSRAEVLAGVLTSSYAKKITENQKREVREKFATVFELLNKLYKETGQIGDNSGNNNNNNSHSVASEGEEPNDRHNAASVGSRPSVGSDPGSTGTVGGRRRSRKTRQSRKAKKARKTRRSRK